MNCDEVQTMLEIALNQLALSAAVIQSAKPERRQLHEIGAYLVTVSGDRIIIKCPTELDQTIVPAIRTLPYPPVGTKCQCCDGKGTISSS